VLAAPVNKVFNRVASGLLSADSEFDFSMIQKETDCYQTFPAVVRYLGFALTDLSFVHI